MDFWNKTINVSREAALQQISIIGTFSSEKRFKIALDFANLGVSRTRDWIIENHPDYSHLEVNLEFVRLMYYTTGQMPEEEWTFFKNKMEEKIRHEWAARFRRMMKANDWGYEDMAKMGGFKNAAVIKSTISRGLPAFAKLAVSVYERMEKETG